MGIKKTIEEVRNLIEKKGYRLISDNYTNNKVKLEVECPKHGVFNSSFGNLKRGRGCPDCGVEVSSEKQRKNFEEVKSWIEQNTEYKLISDTYINNRVKLEIECPKHGIFKMNYNSLQNKQGCPKCGLESSIKKQRKNFKEVKGDVEKKGYKLISNTYINSKTKLEVECPKHGIFKIRYNDLQQGISCATCKTVISKSHQEIIDYIDNIYDKEIKINDRTVLEGKELDIYLPDMNFGIEFDGLYWHSEKAKSDAKKQNKEKIAKIQEKDVKVLIIFEDEWLNPTKQKLIKEMIQYRITRPSKTIRASKLTLKKLDKNKYFKEFFEKYHLDGSVNASFAYGLFDGEELVSCMSFRKSFSDKCWEIARFATKSDVKIHGNAGRMVKAFVSEYREKLVTYSNNRLSHGKTYEKLGFKEITKTKDPSYYYTDFQVRIWRFKCKRINEPEVLAKYPTERAQAEGGVFSERFLGHNNPLYKIYDYGHRKWLYDTI